MTDLTKLSPAQAALLAGLPKSPSTLDPYRFAQVDGKGRLVVPPDSPPVVRRNYILSSLNASARWTTCRRRSCRRRSTSRSSSSATGPALKAPQFTWQVRSQLDAIIGDGPPVDTGGYPVITTLDWNAQYQAERSLSAAVIAPNLKKVAGNRLLRSLKIPKSDLGWIDDLRGKDLHNASLVALDYRTGDVIAYAGCAGYYQDSLASRGSTRSTTSPATASASPDRPGSRSCTRARSTPASSRRAASSSTSRRSSTAARTGRRATQTSSSADPFSFARPSSTR